MDCDFGGPGAMGTTPPDFALGMLPDAELAPFAFDVDAPTEVVDWGDSESPPLAFPDVGVVTGV